MIQFQNADVNYTLRQKSVVKSWIKEVIASHQKKTGNLSVVFCSDDYLLNINKQYLQHDYYTDIITFDYSEKNTVSGDLIISVDRVKENAESLKTSFAEELHRVMIHGTLHLIGFKDKTKSQQEQMRKEEDRALKKLDL